MTIGKLEMGVSWIPIDSDFPLVSLRESHSPLGKTWILFLRPLCVAMRWRKAKP